MTAKTLLILIAALLIAACGDTNPTDADLNIGHDIAPLVATTTSAGSVTYGPRVYLLDPATTNAASLQNDTLVFPVQGTIGIAARQPGDVLVSASGSSNRFLAKVVSVHQVGSNFVVKFTQAAVTDAVKDADLHMVLGQPAPAQSPVNGVVPLSTGSGGLFGNGTIDVSASAGIACGPHMKCIVGTGQRIIPELGGHVTPSASVDFDLKINGFNVEHLKFVAHGSLDALAELGIRIENKGIWRLEVSLIEIEEPVPVGEIPTIVKAGVYVGGEGELFQPAVEYKLSEGFKVDVAAGFEMGADHVAHGIFDQHISTSASFERNDRITETRGKAYVAMKVGWLFGVKIAGVTVIEAGPELVHRWYVQGRAYSDRPGDGPWFEKDIGDDISAVGTVDVLGIVGGGISIKLSDEFVVLSKDPLPRDVFYFLPCFLAKDGDYCGDEVRDDFKLGIPGHLYECKGNEQMFDEACPNGCGPATGADKAQGKRVACIPGPTTTPPVPTPEQGPSAPCGAGDHAGPNNGTCGPDGRNYYCYQGTWYLKDDCLAKQQICEVQPPGVADFCVAKSSGTERPPSAPCGAGDHAGPNNGMCGPDGRVYYCYQGVWRLKDDCVAKSQSCVVEPDGVADICLAQSRRLTGPSAPCGAGDHAGPNNGMCGPDGRVYYCYQGTWSLKDDCVARSAGCVVKPPGVADVCANSCNASSECITGESCTSGRCVCPGPVCGTSCCGADAWCGSGSRCCTGCAPGCPC
jgi:hypothetical protein